MGTQLRAQGESIIANATSAFNHSAICQHKKKLIFTGAVAATGYYAYKTVSHGTKARLAQCSGCQYLAPLVEDPMVKEVMKQMASPGGVSP